MAQTKVFSVNSSGDRFTLKLTLTEGDYSVENNTSPVSYSLELIANKSYHFSQYAIGSKISLGGVEVHNQARTAAKQYSIASYGTLTLASGTKQITHNDDGSKTLSYSFSIDMAKVDYTPGALSKSGTMTLATIPRKAKITSAPKSFKDAETPEIAFSNPGGFSLAPYIKVFDDSGKEVYTKTYTKAKYSSPFEFTLTDTEMSNLLNAANKQKSYNVTLGLTTHLSSSKTDYDEKSSTLNIVNADPTFSSSGVSYVDTNSATKKLTDKDTDIVSMLSKVGVTWSAATGNKGANITRYDIALGGVYKSVTSAPESGSYVSLGTVTSNVDLTLFVTAYDSRGNFKAVQKTVKMIPYSEPKIAPHKSLTYVDCYRCDENGAKSSNGTYLKVEAQKQWSALNTLLNTCKLQVQIDGTWIDLETTDIAGNSANNYVSSGDFSGVVPDKTLELKKSYTVSVRSIDSFGKESISLSFKIPTQDVDFHLKKGAAFGEFVTESDTLKLAYSWEAHGLYGLGKCKKAVSTNANVFKEKFKIYAISYDITQNGKNWPEKGSIGLLVVYSADGSGNTKATQTGTFCKIGQKFISATTGKEYVRVLSHAYDDNSWTYGAWVE